MVNPQDKPEADELLDEKETAAILGVRIGTLQVWRCTKRYPLPYVRVGRNIRYQRSAIQQFIASRTVPA